MKVLFLTSRNKTDTKFVKLLEIRRRLKPELTDIEIIERVRDGDQYAFSILVERYQDIVAKTVYGMLGHVAEADDVGQEVFIRFYKSMTEFRGEASLSTYLTRIAINLSLNEIKRRKRNDLFFFYKDRDDDKKESDVIDEVDQAEDYENSELVTAALDTLDARSRSIVVLRMIQGYSTKETAEMLNIPLGTVLSRLARSQEKMKVVLKRMMTESISDY